MKDKKKMEERGATVRAFVLGTILSGVIAWATVLFDIVGDEAYPSANLLPAMPYMLLVLAALLLNPLLRRLKWVRAFSVSELLLIFVMTGVSCGLASWGMVGTMIPKIAALSNPAWNNAQSQWDMRAMPFVHEDYVISAEGTQAAALELYQADVAFKEARALYRAARELNTAHEDVARIETERAALAALTDPKKRSLQEQELAWAESRALRLMSLSKVNWERLGAEHDLAQVLAESEDQIAQLKARRTELQDALQELNADAFQEGQWVREGLPEGRRAIPGFIPEEGESWASYQAKLRRLEVGSEGLKVLRAAAAALETSIETSAALPPQWSDEIDGVADALDAITRVEALENQLRERTEKRTALEEQITGDKDEQRRLRSLRRFAEDSRFEVYDRKIETIETTITELEAELEVLQTRIDTELTPSLDLSERVAESQTALRALAVDARAAAPEAYPDLLDRLRVEEASFVAFGAAPRSFWIGDISWGIWVKPLLRWVLLACVVFMVYMTLNALIYRQWSHHEKLIYPIAEVTSILAKGGVPGSGPSIYKNGLFWLGVALSAGILGWNHAAGTGLIPKVSPIKLEFLWISYVGGGVLKGLASTYFCIIFAVIGLTFLVPASISYSLWFFEVLYLLFLLVLTWLGYGNNRWDLGNPARSQVGMGGMLVFGLVLVWTCRQYLFCAFRSSVLSTLPDDERRELRVSSALFMASSFILLLVMVFQFGAHPVQATVYFVLSICCAIVLMRAVTEGGVLSFESGALAIGMVSTLVGTDKSWWNPKLLVPFSIVGGVMFGSVKVFIAASMANAFKIREDISIRRPTFHAAIWIGILTSIAVASVTLIILCYDRGANTLDGWMHGHAAKGTFNGIAGQAVSDGAPANPVQQKWYLVGIVMMAGLLLARQKFFGIPHPLGLVMLMNPVMFGFWGSILIGWSCKHLASKYCTKDQYEMIRGFFVGLVVGHLSVVLFGWAHMSWHWG